MSDEKKQVIITAGSGALQNLKVLNPQLKVVFQKGGEQ